MSPLPAVSLIVTQRERFIFTRPSLESILADRSYPFNLIYVDGNSPPHIRDYLEEQALKHEFITLIRRGHYLRSNEARNLALPLTKMSDYVVFIDNDVLVQSGWLKPLVDCAEGEHAGIVAPLILQGNPDSSEDEIHVAGIRTTIHQRRGGKIWFEQKQLLQGAKLSDHQGKLGRSPVDHVEIHCMLVRRSLMDQVVLEEAFDNLASHTDLCIQVASLGEKIFLEGRSMVKFLSPEFDMAGDKDDIRFYLFKWSEKSVRQTFARAKQKWKLEHNDPSIWVVWRWVIQNRQLPLKALTSEGDFYRRLLAICHYRWCPGWVRMLIERIVLKLTFQRSGLSSRLA